MDAVRIDLRAYTASFRVPGMMGYQVTSPVPPPATVYGLLAAAMGREVTPDEAWIAYRFAYEAQAQDVEKIIIYGQDGPYWDKALYAPKTNIVTRQFLFQPHLVLYLPPGEVAQSFLRPRFPLLLGRSQDVAYVERFAPTSLEPASQAQTAGVLVPFPAENVKFRSQLLSFPTFFPLATRRALSVKPFHVLDAVHGPQQVSVTGLFYQEIEQRELLAVPLFDRRVLV